MKKPVQIQNEILIREITRADASAWEALRRELWPDGIEDHAREIAMFFAGTLEEPAAVLVVEVEGSLTAFAELSIRCDIPGLIRQRAGYVEGLYVVPEFRGHGIARKLLTASRSWARQQNCTALASDRKDRIIISKTF